MDGDIGFIPTFEPRQRIRTTIVSTLQAAIVAGQLEPGQVYSAPKLAAQFGVSATPVREAMLALVRDGLVDTVPNRGFRIRELSGHELDELCDLRLLIEVPTVGRICTLDVDPGVIERLRTLATETEVAATAHDMVAHSQADLDFHTELLTLAGNANLVTIVRDLRKRSRLHGLALHTNRDQLIQSSHEHSRLVDLVAQHDAAAAEALMHKHITDVRDVWADHRQGPPHDVQGMPHSVPNTPAATPASR